MANKFSLLSNVMQKFAEGSIVGLSNEGQLLSVNSGSPVVIEGFQGLPVAEQGFVLEQVLSSQTHIIKSYMDDKVQEAVRRQRLAQTGNLVALPPSHP